MVARDTTICASGSVYFRRQQPEIVRLHFRQDVRGLVVNRILRNNVRFDVGELQEGQFVWTH